MANQIVKPLLTVVNQERVLYLKKRSAQGLVSLLRVSQLHSLNVLSRKTLTLVLQMMEVDTVTEQDALSEAREQTLRYFVQELIKSSPVTIYEGFGGVIGTLCLKPQWAKGPDSKDAPARPAHVVKWLRVVTILVKSTQKVASQLDAQVRLRYKALAQRAIVELIVQALEALQPPGGASGGLAAQHGALHLLPANAHLLPGLVDLIFDQLMPGQRAQLVEALVRQLEAKARVAFDCLDRLLDT